MVGGNFSWSYKKDMATSEQLSLLIYVHWELCECRRKLCTWQKHKTHNNSDEIINIRKRQNITSFGIHFTILGQQQLEKINVGFRVWAVIGNKCGKDDTTQIMLITQLVRLH